LPDPVSDPKGIDQPIAVITFSVCSGACFGAAKEHRDTLHENEEEINRYYKYYGTTNDISHKEIRIMLFIIYLFFQDLGKLDNLLLLWAVFDKDGLSLI